jgi:hypothetical protein
MSVGRVIGISRKSLEEQWGAFPPCTMVGIEVHKAKWREHICAECMGKIGIGDRYKRVVYRNEEMERLEQYKTHLVCPWEEQCDDYYRR